MPNSQRQPLFISPKEAAGRHSVSVDTIRRRIADGTLPAHRLGKRLIRISIEDLDKVFRPIPTTGGGRVA
ncbi:excisionase family DNA-binding protein [Ammonicoccus fulvus]|uniref:Excisionase family DNA-binding protein n=1 Tax=Ammonicoccus fulvus TaxID=3138240 RepID=A0ABZ3FR87_9ACTN